MCAACINVPVFICLTYSLTYITYLRQVTIIHRQLFHHFSPHNTFLSLYVLGLKHSRPSALNDEAHNLLLGTPVTAILFRCCNETERAVCACVPACVLCYRCLMVRLKGSNEDSITVACCCSQPVATRTHTHTQARTHPDTNLYTVTRLPVRTLHAMHIVH